MLLQYPNFELFANDDNCLVSQYDSLVQMFVCLFAVHTHTHTHIYTHTHTHTHNIYVIKVSRTKR
jgi:hypothetical protein